jgi:hypothetical protein
MNLIEAVYKLTTEADSRGFEAEEWKQGYMSKKQENRISGVHNLS